jgi:hypothetical protein
MRSDIQVFIDHHRGPDPSNPNQLCSQLATYALVSCHHFSMLCTVVLALTCISVVFARKNMTKKWRDSMERGSIGESKNSTRWPCTLAEGERAMDGESMVSF